MKLNKITRAFALSSALFIGIHTPNVHAASAITTGGASAIAATAIAWGLTFTAVGPLVVGTFTGGLSGLCVYSCTGDEDATAATFGCMGGLSVIASLVAGIVVGSIFLDGDIPKELPIFNKVELDKAATYDVTEDEAERYNGMVDSINQAREKLFIAFQEAYQDSQDEAKAKAAFNEFTLELQEDSDVDLNLLEKLMANQGCRQLILA